MTAHSSTQSPSRRRYLTVALGVAYSGRRPPSCIEVFLGVAHADGFETGGGPPTDALLFSLTTMAPSKTGRFTCWA